MTIEHLADATPGPCEMCGATEGARMHRFQGDVATHRRRLCPPCHESLNGQGGMPALMRIIAHKVARQVAEDQPDN